MRDVVIIAVGDEIVEGRTVNSNSSRAACLLTELGWHVAKHIAVPDTEGAIAAALMEAINLSSLILCIGGLGATIDDKTKQAVADALGLPLILDSRWQEELTHRFRVSNQQGSYTMLIEQQSMVPQGARLIRNENGTAPGMSLSIMREKKPIQIVLLPGPPIECQSILSEAIKEKIIDSPLRYDAPVSSRSFRIVGVNENEVNPSLVQFEKEHSGISLGIYPGYGYVDVIVRSRAEEMYGERVDVLKDRLKESLHAHFPHTAFLTGSEPIEKAVMDRLFSQQWSISTAESCTGGAIAQALSSVQGASKVFYGGFVVYTPSMKKKLLGLTEEELEQHSIVSEAITESMAKKSALTTGSALALATSGFFGPSGGDRKDDPPIGTVCCSLYAAPGYIRSFRFHFFGDRNAIAQKCKGRILSELLLFIVSLEKKGIVSI